MSLHLFVQDRCKNPAEVVEIDVNPEDSVGSIFRCIEKRQNQVILMMRSGFSALSPAFSFAHYGICNGETIFVSQLPSKRKRMLQRPFREVFKQCEEKNGRNKDILFQKIEGNYRCHRSVVTRFLTLLAEADEHNYEIEQEVTDASMGQLTAPSTDALPTLWVSETKNK